MLNLNPTTLAAVVDKARTDAAEHPRWLAAIDRAVVELLQNPWIERGELHGVIIASPSGNLYSANGTCQCRAHAYGNPCWHRAAARLVRLHDEAAQPLSGTEKRALARAADTALAVHFQPSDASRAAYEKAAAAMDELFA